MGRFVILNGSPRAPRSNSRRYGELFLSSWKGEAVCFDIVRADPGELCSAVAQASGVLLVFPLYADAIPAVLLNFLKELERNPPRNRPSVSVLVNCGFLESWQNDVAVEMIRLFCKRNGYPFGAVLKIGSGEAILDTPFRFLAAGKIRRFARAVAKGENRTFAVTMPLTKKLFVAASTRYWTDYGKRRGVTREQMDTMDIERRTLPDPHV